MTEDKLQVIKIDNNIINTRYNKWTIISPNIYYNSFNKSYYVKCMCDCGHIDFTTLKDIKSGKSKHCLHCYDNFVVVINDYISILKIHDFRKSSWENIFINTECVSNITTDGNWYIKYSNSTDGRREIIRHIKSTKSLEYLSRFIVSCINKKYNIKQDTYFQVDHINGDQFNNLYYPFNDYYNNLRVCTTRQNNLNIPCNGYTKKNSSYIASIYVNSSARRKSFHSPEECIEWNISQLSDIDKQYYYLSPYNPRNWDWTFSNTILNDEYDYNDTDFMDDDFEDIWDEI